MNEEESNEILKNNSNDQDKQGKRERGGEKCYGFETACSSSGSSKGTVKNTRTTARVRQIKKSWDFCLLLFGWEI